MTLILTLTSTKRSRPWALSIKHLCFNNKTTITPNSQTAYLQSHSAQSTPMDGDVRGLKENITSN